MAASPIVTNVPLAQLRQQFFEPQLASLGLSAEQIAGQDLAALQTSLDRVSDAIAHPESFGTLKVRTEPMRVVMLTTPELNYEIGILPLLLDRKRLILDRMRLLKGKEQIETLEDVVHQVSDAQVRSQLAAKLEELKRTEEKSQEAREKLNRQVDEVQRQQENALVKAAAFERTARVWLSFLEREPMASLLGGILLIVLTGALIAAVFLGMAPLEILANAFLVILGYFFGQAVGRATANTSSGGATV